MIIYDLFIYQKRKGSSSKNIMHNKCFGIDNYTVIDGSYN